MPGGTRSRSPSACVFHAGFLRPQTDRNYQCSRAGSQYHLLKEL